MNDRYRRGRSPRRPVQRQGPAVPARSQRPPSAAHARFLELGRDRAAREWARYEGTAQRDVFRQLRVRFLRRHAREGGWALDAGAGPGRFSRSVGGATACRVALDLSLEMLRFGREKARGEPPPVSVPVAWVRGDALRPPFPAASFAEVALVGNALGFEAAAGKALLSGVEALVAPGGMLVVEIAPGPGERSRYLGRLPSGAVRRLLAAPTAAVLPRVMREGFDAEPVRHRSGEFRRWTAGEVLGRWRQAGWAVHETMAVAPALGPDRPRLQEVARDPHAWDRLLDLEEQLGREPPRWPNAAALLVAVERPALQTNGFVGGRTSLDS